MAYQVLARKWRPKNFTQLVGQEYVSRSLINALQYNRLHHAYLFTGTRGIGKTTIARILAKAINCENLTDNNPCSECRICLAFEANIFLDLIEVDAASRTKVEDTKNLLDNVQYAPNQGQYKIYLIDEVHMLSGHSFNALLKTLEEPPTHVKFLLATTDPQKIPVTVLSRCLQFNLKRLLPKQIATQMCYILKQEQIKFEPSGLNLLSRAADGSMRDGLSLLDQAIAFGGGEVKLDAVSQMLGTVAPQPIHDILLSLARNDATKLLQQIADIAELTPDFSDILQNILSALHRIALTQTIAGFIDEDCVVNANIIKQLANKFLPEDVQLFYQMGLIGQRDLELAPDSRGGFEMIMLRMLTFKKDYNETINNTPQIVINQSAKSVTKSDIEKSNQKINNNWLETVKALNVQGIIQELASSCVMESIDNVACRLIIAVKHIQLLSSQNKEKLQQAMQEYYGRPIKLIINIGKINPKKPAQLAKVNSNNANKNVQILKECFDARVISGTIDSIKSSGQQ